MPMLGYDVVGPPGSSKLVVNEDEAARVRAIFELYLNRQSLIETVKELDGRGWTTKRWATRKGHERGGLPFNKNRLFRLLTNVVYLGKITYKDEVHEGEHTAIVDADIFDRAQRLLKRNGVTGGKHVRNRFGALLKGILRCAPCGCGMVHTHTTKNGNKRYRYYICQNAQSRGWQSCPSPSVPAREIEQFVVEQVTRARVTQIMNLLNLAPDIQEELLFLPRTLQGRDPIREHVLRPIAAVLDWRKQRGMWKAIGAPPAPSG